MLSYEDKLAAPRAKHVRGWVLTRGGLPALVAAVTVLCCTASAASAAISAVEGTAFSGTVTTIDSQCPSATVISATIGWGDGGSSAGTVTRNQDQLIVSGSHTYARYGSYSGSAAVNLDCNGSTFTQTGNFTATVSDAPLSAGGTAVSAVTGQQFTATVAHLTDSNPDGVASDDTATIGWGDGGTSSGTVTAEAGGGFAITGTHTYASAGSDTITVSVSSSGGSTASATSTATVSAPPPRVQAQFSVFGSAAGRIELDASASAPGGSTARYYDWTLGSAPGQDVVCPASEPQVQLNVRSGVNTGVTLSTVDSATGFRSSTTHVVSIPSPAAASASRRGLSVIGLCSGGVLPRVPPLRSANLPGSERPPISVDGAPPGDCGQDLVFGAADVRGCLNPIPEPKDIPGGIDSVLSKLLCGAHDKDFCLLAGAITSVAHSFASAASVQLSEKQLTTVKQTMAELVFPSYYSYSAIRLDGVDIVPQNGSPILILPAADAIVAPEVRVVLGGHLIEPATIPLALYVPATGGQLATLTIPHTLPLIGSLPFNGSISIALARAHTLLSNGDTCQFACAALTVSAELPGVFSDDNGNGLSATGVITADAVNGIQLDSLEVKVPSAQIAGIGVSDVDIRYSHANDSLHAQATLNLFDAAGNITGVVDFLHGGFQDASVAWDAGDGPGIDLGGPLNIYLTHLGGSISLNPTTINANGTITGGPQTLGCSLFGLNGSITMQFGPFALDANATGQLLCENVAHEYFHIDQTGSILIGGNIDISLLFFEFQGGLQIAANTDQGHFQADANMSACVNFAGTHCVGAEVVISDRGAGLCANLTFAHVGGGIQWPDHVITFFDSCDIGKFRSLGFVTAANLAPTFTIPKGQAVSAIGVSGAGGAPHVTLHGPQGQTIDTPTDGYELTSQRMVVADATGSHETYFLLNHATPGRWQVTTDPGSVAVTGIQQAAGLPSPNVRARVARRAGGRLALIYRLHPLAGQQVTFVEHDARGRTHTIGSAHGGAGRLAFASTPLLSPRRTIVAEVSQDGHPREDDVVARYTAPPLAPLAAPSRLRVARRGNTLVVTWRPVTGAYAYAVTANLRDHSRRFTQVKKTSAVIAGFPAGTGARIQVRALRVTAGNRLGSAALVTLASSPRAHRVKVRPA
jgi:hypothetical protein